MQGGITIMMKGIWYKVPSELFNYHEFTKADMAVFAYVADRIKGEAKAVSIRSIGVSTELSRRQIQASLKKLCEYGFLEAQERTGAPTVYRQTLIPYKATEDTDEGAERDIYRRVREVS